jgi:hypothetical protein
MHTGTHTHARTHTHTHTHPHPPTGNLPIKPYTGTTVYTLDERSGRVTQHTESWDISALDAFVSTLLPGFGAPPAPPVAAPQ